MESKMPPHAKQNGLWLSDRRHHSIFVWLLFTYSRLLTCLLSDSCESLNRIRIRHEIHMNMEGCATIKSTMRLSSASIASHMKKSNIRLSCVCRNTRWGLACACLCVYPDVEISHFNFVKDIFVTHVLAQVAFSAFRRSINTHQVANSMSVALPASRNNKLNFRCSHLIIFTFEYI